MDYGNRTVLRGGSGSWLGGSSGGGSWGFLFLIVSEQVLLSFSGEAHTTDDVGGFVGFPAGPHVQLFMCAAPAYGAGLRYDYEIHPLDSIRLTRRADDMEMVSIYPGMAMEPTHYLRQTSHVHPCMSIRTSKP